jgi:DNA-binding transcriptional regulator LsrR (DeoR family)
MMDRITPDRDDGGAAKLDESERPTGTALLVEVAKLHYQQEVTKTDIAARLGLSRFQVARLLRAATRRGVVEIFVHEVDDPRTDLAARTDIAARADIASRAGDSRPGEIRRPPRR